MLMVKSRGQAVPLSDLAAFQEVLHQRRASTGLTAVDGRVLGFFSVGVLLERPPDGGAVYDKLKVPDPPTGTKDFKVWLIHQEFYFFDKQTGESLERPIWTILTDVYAHKEGADWFIEWLCGWADKGDKTHWEGLVAVTGIAVG